MYFCCLCRFSNSFAILNDVILDILIHKYLFVLLIISLGKIPRVEIPEPKVINKIRILFHISGLFFKRRALNYFPTKSLRVFISIHPHQNWGISFVFNLSLNWWFSERHTFLAISLGWTSSQMVSWMWSSLRVRIHVWNLALPLVVVIFLNAIYPFKFPLSSSVKWEWELLFISDSFLVRTKWDSICEYPLQTLLHPTLSPSTLSVIIMIFIQNSKIQCCQG